MIDRRQAGSGQMRRGARAAGGSSTTIDALLGTNLVEQWDTRTIVPLAGPVVDPWTGSKIGLSATAAAAGNRPTFTASNALFRGKPTFATRVTGNKALRMGADHGSDIIATGGRPYIAMVASSPLTGAVIFELTTAGAGANLFEFVVSGGAIGVQLAGVLKGTDPASDTSPHLYEAWISAGNHVLLAKDGTTVSDDATGAVLSGAIRRVAFGVYAGGSFEGDADFAWAGICTVVPSAGERAGLLAYARATWGTP